MTSPDWKLGRHTLAFEPKTLSEDVIHVLPSTLDTLALIPEWRSAEQAPIVVAPLVVGCTDASQFLSDLKLANRRNPINTIIFSDQLVSAVDAPLLVEHDGTRSYFPAVELIAHVEYGFELHVWTGSAFNALRPPTKEVDVLRLLFRYFSACDELGQQWLMREGRRQSCPTQRATQARIRLRTFHSALMHAFQDSAFPPSCRRIAAKLIEAERTIRGH